MRKLTKAEACRELGLSLSTLDRRIAAGELQARREPHGRRHRVYVVLDDDPPGKDKDVKSGNTALAVAQERIRGLEAQVAMLQEQLEQERRRNAGLVNELRAAPERRGPRWRFWERGGDQDHCKVAKQVFSEVFFPSFPRRRESRPPWRCHIRPERLKFVQHHENFAVVLWQ